MLKKSVEEILNRQVEREGYSSHLYLAMASWAEMQGYEGMAKWLYAQADEERLHMLKFIAYLNERGGQARVSALKQPPAAFENPKKMFTQVLAHEQFVTASINEIVEECVKSKDFTTHNWVQWFVNEQIQEEKSARAILDKLKLLGDGNLYHFDRDVFGMRAAEAAADAPAA